MDDIAPDLSDPVEQKDAQSIEEKFGTTLKADDSATIEHACDQIKSPIKLIVIYDFCQ
jgi:hypothetical protein